MLLPCKECGNLISNLATMCPHCGYSENGLVEQNATMPIKYEEGHYKIGIDMPAGEYSLQCIDTNFLGYYKLSADANGQNIIAIDNFKRNSYVDVKDGQYFRINNCVAVPTNLTSSISPNSTITKAPTEDTADEKSHACPIEDLFNIYNSIVFIDIKTTDMKKYSGNIIEIAAILVVLRDGKLTISHSMDEFIKIDTEISQEIEEQTGISNNMLLTEGVEKSVAQSKLRQLMTYHKNTLLVAHNTNFVVNSINRFSYSALHDLGKNIDMLDIASIYKDRKQSRHFGHKLQHITDSYSINYEPEKNHRAIDNCYVIMELMKAMAFEKNDLHEYINCFGYNHRAGIIPSRLEKICYVPQTCACKESLYDILHNMSTAVTEIKRNSNIEEDSCAWLSMGEKLYNDGSYMMSIFCFFRVLSLCNSGNMINASLASYYIGVCYLFDRGLAKNNSSADEYFRYCFQYMVDHTQYYDEEEFSIKNEYGSLDISDNLYYEMESFFNYSSFDNPYNMKSELIDCLTLNCKLSPEIKRKIYHCKNSSELRTFFHLHKEIYCDFILYSFHITEYWQKYKECWKKEYDDHLIKKAKDLEENYMLNIVKVCSGYFVYEHYSTSMRIYKFNLKEYSKSRETLQSTKDKHINYTVYDCSQPEQNEYGYISEEALEDYEEYRRDWNEYMNEYE